MRLQNLFYLFFSMLILASCSSDDDGIINLPEEEEAFSNGIFVLNEGNWGSANSSISFLDAETKTMSHNIFSTVNGTSVGDTANDIGFYEDYAFVVVNISNTVEIVNRNSFEKVATIENHLENPRKIAFLNGLAYVTNWGDSGVPDDDFVAVFNAETFEFITSVSVVEGPEDIVVNDDYVFVAHEGGHNFNNVISVISETAVIKEITVGTMPSNISMGDDFLWISSHGVPDYTNAGTAGSISKIDLNTLEVVKTYNFEANTQHPGAIALENNRVYYILNNEIYSMSIDADELPTQSHFVLQDVSNLYGFAINNGKAYATSAAADFTSNGKFFIYDLSGGALLESYDTGINPNGVYFNE